MYIDEWIKFNGKNLVWLSTCLNKIKITKTN